LAKPCIGCRRKALAARQPQKSGSPRNFDAGHRSAPPQAARLPEQEAHHQLLCITADMQPGVYEAEALHGSCVAL
jgi:hypothetical protein